MDLMHGAMHFTIRSNIWVSQKEQLRLLDGSNRTEEEKHMSTYLSMVQLSPHAASRITPPERHGGNVRRAPMHLCKTTNPKTPNGDHTMHGEETVAIRWGIVRVRRSARMERDARYHEREAIQESNHGPGSRRGGPSSAHSTAPILGRVRQPYMGCAERWGAGRRGAG